MVPRSAYFYEYTLFIPLYLERIESKFLLTGWETK